MDLKKVTIWNLCTHIFTSWAKPSLLLIITYYANTSLNNNSDGCLYQKFAVAQISHKTRGDFGRHRLNYVFHIKGRLFQIICFAMWGAVQLEEHVSQNKNNQFEDSSLKWNIVMIGLKVHFIIWLSPKVLRRRKYIRTDSILICEV